MSKTIILIMLVCLVCCFLCGCAVREARNNALIATYGFYQRQAELLKEQPSIQQMMQAGVLVNKRSKTVTFIFRGGIVGFSQEVPSKEEIPFSMLPGAYNLIIEEDGRIIHRERSVIDAIGSNRYHNGVPVDFVVTAYVSYR